MTPNPIRSTAPIRIAGSVNLLLGAVVVASGWVTLKDSVDSSPALSSLVMGYLIVVCAGLRTIWPEKTLALGGANIALGFWIAASPWTYGYATDTSRLRWTIGLGFGVIGAAIWGLYSAHRAARRTN